MKYLTASLILVICSLFPHSAEALEGGAQGGAFSSNLRTLFFFDMQDPAHSTQNPDNAFLRVYRYSGELDVRPDFFFNAPSVDAVFKPRFLSLYRWWEDGVAHGESDALNRAFVSEWRAQIKPHDKLFLSFGKEKLLWGSSFLVSPSNLLFKDTEKVNPKSEVEGKYLARAVYIPNNTFTISIISRTQKEESVLQEKERPVRAVKIEMMGSSSLIGLISYFQQHDRFRLGSYGQWTASDALVLYFDGIVARGTDVLYPVQNPANPLGAEFIQPYNDSGRLFTTVTVGGSYTFLSGSTLSIEFLYNGAGYGDAEARDYYNLRRNASEHFFDSGPMAGLSALTLSEALNTGSPFLRRCYLMAQFQSKEIRNVLDIILRYTYSPEERSGQASTIIEWRLSNRVRFFNINTAATGGGRETEFNSILTKSVLAGIEAHF